MFFAVVLSVYLAAYSVSYGRKHGWTKQVAAFTVATAGIAQWTLFALLEMTATDYPTTLLMYKLGHVGAWTVPSAFLFYAATTGDAARWVTRKTVAAAAALLVPLFVLVFTAPNASLFINPDLNYLGSFSVIAHGNQPLYTVYLGFAYACVLLGIVYVFLQVLSDDGIPLRQAGVLIAGAAVPLTLSVIQTVTPPNVLVPGTIVTPLSFVLTTTLLGYNTFRYNVFDMAAQARAQTVDQMQEGYLLCNGEGYIVDANTTAMRLLGRDTSVIGSHIRDAAPALDLSHSADVSDPSLIETEIEITPENATRTFEVSVSPVERDGLPVGRLLVFRDITDRKAAERQLKNQKEQLEFLNQFVRHDIRNKMDVIIKRLRLVTDRVDDRDGEPPEYVSHVDAAVRTSETVVDLTETVRDLTEAVSKVNDDREPIPLRSVLERSVANASTISADTTVTIEGEIPDVAVVANDMLDAVFRNLLSNAIQHNDAAEPMVVVTVTAAADEVTVRIADNGPGIPDDLKSSVFDKGITGTQSRGTGMGLYLVKMLVDQYEGEIQALDRADTPFSEPNGRAPAAARDETERGRTAAASTAFDGDTATTGTVFELTLPRARKP